jgi:hypothetical protein
MSLYICEKCGTIENTALSSYWWKKEKLCSQCDPQIAKWHGVFKRNKFDKEKQILVDGFVISKQDFNEPKA